MITYLSQVRRPVQITASDEVIVALCNDGSLWATRLEYEQQVWIRLPPIPQDVKKPKIPASDPEGPALYEEYFPENT